MALAHIRVLEFEALPPLQFTGQMLADQGATVIIVKSSKGMKSGKFQTLTRGKSEIALDLKNEKDREFLLNEIIPKIDVLLESYRPGTMEKLGLSPETVHLKNPALVYVRLSGYGQIPSKQRERAGHDMNYLALSGILTKFRRNASTIPSPPSNMLADFASGSLYTFNLILQALYLKKPKTVIDSSLTHNTMYLTQPELLKAVILSSANRNKNKNEIAFSHFTRPEQCVYKDQNGVYFVLKPGAKIYEEIKLQHYNDEENEESTTYADILMVNFQSMTIEEIEKQFGSVQVLKDYQEVLEKQNEVSKGLVKRVDDDRYEIGNIFDREFKNYSKDQANGYEMLKLMGIKEEKIEQIKSIQSQNTVLAKL